MVYDPDDTIAAIGTAPGGAVRGMIRLSGPQVVTCLASCFQPHDGTELSSITSPSIIAGSISLNAATVPCDLFLWPTDRSYTRQPSAELHTLGSPPLLQEMLTRLCDGGARLAQPGEFTMRAFLAGRLDLTQAEAVLGVIDSQSFDEFQSSLTQLAGGLSSPLAQLREELIQLLAELEAGLDFVDEDIEFITQEQLQTQISAAQRLVSQVSEQLSQRESTAPLPRVVLSGAPNAGKSSLFNALVEHYAASEQEQQALVSAESGTTRDFVSAALRVTHFSFELVDTAGIDTVDAANGIGRMAQAATGAQREQADLLLSCVDGTVADASAASKEFVVLTKCDLVDSEATTSPNVIACSSVTGEGLPALANLIVQQLNTTSAEASDSRQLTSVRCKESLSSAQIALSQALDLVESHGGEELIAAEVRAALDALGQVVGTVYTDDILDRIFGQFCIGK